MRRRTFLTTLGAAAGAGLYGCSAKHPKSTVSDSTSPSATAPASPTPPTPTATPIVFGAEPLWPPPGVISDQDQTLGEGCQILHVHGRYLIGAIGAHYLPGQTDVTGMCPVIVDLTGPTTYAILPDGVSGGYHAAEVKPTAPGNNATETSKVGAVAHLATGPSTLDDNHAYIVVGKTDGVTGSSNTSDENMPLSLLKIQLSDYKATASVQLSSSFPTSAFALQDSPSGRLLFTADGTALMLTTGSDPYLALRLSATDLSTQFDAHSVLTYAYLKDLGGEAVCTSKYSSSTEPGTVVTLTDGASHTVSDSPKYVCRKWLYARRYTTAGSTVVMINVDTGEEFTLTGFPYELSDMQHTATSGDYIITCTNNQIDVRTPGSTSPTLTWNSAERAVPNSGQVYGDVLYACYMSGRITLVDLHTGEELDNRQFTPFQQACVSFVTPYGISTGRFFYPTTEWMTDSKSAAPTSS